jgi:Fe2+ or Zn2+ uptake regulation protein
MTLQHHFTCSKCDEPFEVDLPMETLRTSYTECKDTDLEHHSLMHVAKCQKCNQTNKIYYCTDEHEY